MVSPAMRGSRLTPGANLSGTAGITNANLANSSVTINGTAVSLGGSATITATATNALTIGTGLSGTSYNGSSAVTIALASGYGDTQNPYASKTANYVLAAPNGTSGVPTFRALVAADVPTLNQNTTGNAATSTTAGNITATSNTTLTSLANLATVGTITSGTWSGTVIGSNVGGAGTVSGLMKANGSGVVSAAVSGTDYQAPYANLTNIGSITNAAEIGRAHV